MKKTLIVLVGLLCANVIFGQQVFNEMRPACNLEEVKHYPQTEFNQMKGSNAYGDVIWEETFGGGSIPTGWVTVDNFQLGHVWLWTSNPNPGLNGQYSSNTDPFLSTTATNGYVVLPGDHYNTPATTGMQDMNAYLMSPAINCDTASSVMLKFEQYYRYCCGNDQIMQVSVSTNNVNWTDYDVSKGVETNITSENPDIVTINITSIAAFQPTVYLKFLLSGVSHYYWAIDDVALVVAPANDIRITKTYVSNAVLVSGNYQLTGFYSSIPMNHITPIAVLADIHNFGNSTQHDVVFNAKVTNSTGVEMYNQNKMLYSLLPDSTELFEIPNYFNAYEADSFEVGFDSYQYETDEEPGNNTSPNVKFKFNHDKVFARDYQRDSKIGVQSFSGALPGDFLGVSYYINTVDTAASISVFIDESTDPGTTIMANLFKTDGTNYTWVVASDEYIIQAGDLGAWVTLPFVPIAPGGNALEAHQTYIAGVDCYYIPGEYIYLGADKNGPHLFHLASALRLTTSWYYISSSLPLIRLNLSGAEVLPFITSTPEYEVEFTDSFSYMVTTFDPQGLPVTLSATALPTNINMQAIDNGDGTMSISTPVISVSSFSSNQFQVSITVDNGIATNQQEFWVHVAHVVGAEETSQKETLIYPNPVRQTLYCKNPGNARIQIFSIPGRLVYENVSAGPDQVIDLSGFSEGTYFIRIIDGDKVHINKFIHIK